MTTPTGPVADALTALGWRPRDLRRALSRLAGVEFHDQTIYRWCWGSDSPNGHPPPPLLLAALALIQRLPEKQREALRRFR